ncbi:MAG TPA: hypothetical protein VK506_12850 [Conexibacter sp.]|nr:hypothetical protein [Conexibacter sp.]
MLTKARTILLAVTLALAAAALPAAAIAKHGADDPPGDDRGGLVRNGDDSGGGDDSSGRGRGGDDDSDDRGGSGGGRGGRDDGRRLVAGSCTGAATSKLKVKNDDGRLEVEFEVDQNRSGVTWQVRISRNGSPVVRTSATTGGRSGSFSVERKIGNPAGSDRISARATSPGGQVCTAAMTF